MKMVFSLLFSLLIGLAPLINACDRQPSKDANPPCVIVIFGATGDLTSRKLLPAIYNLAHDGHISENIGVVAFARGSHTHESFRNKMGDAIDQFSRSKPRDGDLWNQFEKKIFYNQSDFESDEGYESLKDLLEKIDQEQGTQGNRIYYLAVQPSYFPVIVKKLHEHHLVYNPEDFDQKWSKVVFEKPFGNDLESALKLQDHISKYLDESQVYRMDHYLGKEGVQNLMAFRFEGSLFEPLWNNQHIDNIQITLAEDIGIGSRANFWEETGSLRDVFQNHLMQLLAIVAMEPPETLDAAAIHAEKLRVLNAIRPFPPNEIDNFVVRGQYGPGVINEESVVGYSQEKGVAEASTAETFAAAKLFIDNSRWSGIPFYIRGGKRLPKQTTEIAIVFKKDKNRTGPSEALFIRIQPHPEIYFRTTAKAPGLGESEQVVVFGASPESYFQGCSREAYEKLIMDCINGDESLYVQAEEQMAAWRLLTPILYYWKSHPPESFTNYEAGTWGPSNVDQLFQEGHQWELLDNRD